MSLKLVAVGVVEITWYFFKSKIASFIQEMFWCGFLSRTVTVLNCIEETQCQNGWWQNSIISASKHFSSWSKHVLVMNKASLRGVFWTGGFNAWKFNIIFEVQTVVLPVGFGSSWRVLSIFIFVSFFFFWNTMTEKFTLVFTFGCLCICGSMRF